MSILCSRDVEDPKSAHFSASIKNCYANLTVFKEFPYLKQFSGFFMTLIIFRVLLFLGKQ